MRTSNYLEHFKDVKNRFQSANEGIAMNEEFIQRLQNGYRMSKPVYAPNEIGDLMADCLKTEPNQRPTFGQLADALGNQSLNITPN